MKIHKTHKQAVESVRRNNIHRFRPPRTSDIERGAIKLARHIWKRPKPNFILEIEKQYLNSDWDFPRNDKKYESKKKGALLSKINKKESMSRHIVVNL